jgi:hypothetical protein
VVEGPTCTTQHPEVNVKFFFRNCFEFAKEKWKWQSTKAGPTPQPMRCFQFGVTYHSGGGGGGGGPCKNMKTSSV